MAGSPRIIARPTTRSPAACRRARVRQGQAFGGAEEVPSLTAAARDGDRNMRSGRKNARGAGSNKRMECKGRPKWRDAPLTKNAPYKPDAVNLHVRFDERGVETELWTSHRIVVFAKSYVPQRTGHRQASFGRSNGGFENLIEVSANFGERRLRVDAVEKLVAL